VKEDLVFEQCAILSNGKEKKYLDMRKFSIVDEIRLRHLKTFQDITYKKKLEKGIRT
jgi:hypothetical protein